VNIYYNGVLQSNVANVNGTGTGLTTQNLFIGKGRGNSTGGQYQGALDDVRIYNRALSVAEVVQLYNSTAGDKLSVSQTGPLSLNSGLVGWWTFDGKNMMQNVADSSGQGNNGNLVNFAATSSVQTAGKVGQALYFAGGVNGSQAGTSVNVGTPSSLNISGNMTISAWIKIAGYPSSSSYIISNANSGASLEQYAFYSTSARTLAFDVNHAVTVAGTIGSVSKNRWYHVLVTRSGSSGSWTFNFYLNGVLNKSVASATDPDASQTVTIGKLVGGGAYYFNGALDDLRVYNRALSVQEITKLYNMGK
jgi:hypothetical protein